MGHTLCAGVSVSPWAGPGLLLLSSLLPPEFSWFSLLRRAPDPEVLEDPLPSSQPHQRPPGPEHVDIRTPMYDIYGDRSITFAVIRRASSSSIYRISLPNIIYIYTYNFIFYFFFFPYYKEIVTILRRCMVHILPVICHNIVACAQWNFILTRWTKGARLQIAKRIPSASNNPVNDLYNFILQAIRVQNYGTKGEREEVRGYVLVVRNRAMRIHTRFGIEVERWKNK